MTTYSITLKLTEKQLLAFVADLSEPLEMTVKAIAAQTPEEEQAPVKQRRGPRTSKVNDAIVAALKDGARQPNDLKEALQKAGLSPGSLSTGLAALQKSGQVNRDPNGGYFLKAA